MSLPFIYQKIFIRFCNFLKTLYRVEVEQKSSSYVKESFVFFLWVSMRKLFIHQHGIFINLLFFITGEETLSTKADYRQVLLRTQQLFFFSTVFIFLLTLCSQYLCITCTSFHFVGFTTALHPFLLFVSYYVSIRCLYLLSSFCR